MADGTARAEGSRPDAGMATIFGCLCVGLFLVVAGIGIRLGGAMLAREQAETAADLGALAGATRMLEGSAVACDCAGTVVRANRGTMVSCTADGLDLLLEVRTPSWGGSAQAHARAGPVSAG
jgi:secretion/DNA translocation related TadE-like protein